MVKMRALGACLVAAVLSSSACSLFRESDRRVRQQQTGVSFYSDLGPDFIDVAAYPPQQRLNYAVYQRVCSQCHTLARSINSPVASREFWEMYAQAMRRRSLMAADQPVTKDDVKEVVDFLDYDSKVRKIDRKDDFDAQTLKLKLRFEEMMEGGRGV